MVFKSTAYPKTRAIVSAAGDIVKNGHSDIIVRLPEYNPRSSPLYRLSINIMDVLKASRTKAKAIFFRPGAV